MVARIVIALMLITSFARAETVDVKYRGGVPLDAFECPALKPSSLVNRLCYDPDTDYLIVQLRQTYYHYCAVEPETFDAWQRALSLGRFYNQKIKGRGYDCRDHPVPEY